MSKRTTTDYDRWDKLTLDDSSDDEKQHPNIDKEFMRRILRDKRAHAMAQQEEEKEALRQEGTPEAMEKLRKLEQRTIVTKDSVRFVDERTMVKGASDDVIALPEPVEGGLKMTTAEDVEVAAQDYSGFIEKHKNILRRFANLSISESQDFILENAVLLQEPAAQFLMLYILDLQMENKGSKARQAARQYLMLRNILDLAAQSKQDVRAAVIPFFTKMDERANKERLNAEAEAFALRVKGRAREKKAEQAALAASDNEERAKRLGPGGLDPLEVFPTLPKPVQGAYEAQDSQALVEALTGLGNDEAERVLDLMVKSGLWNPQGSASNTPPSNLEKVELGVCAVIGAGGLVGTRLCAMLVERRGVTGVVCIDVRELEDDVPRPSSPLKHGVRTVVATVADAAAMCAALKGVNTVFHSAALVGPYHPHALYEEVNYRGTLNVIDACKANHVARLVFVSSPSTRFDGGDITGQTEAELSFPKTYAQEYARTKAMGEQAAIAANSTDGKGLLVCAVAPHQVYGPGDTLFVPSFIESAINKKLRIIGRGDNRISVCYVDNICEGLMLGGERLYAGSPTCGQFYIITDGKDIGFWDFADRMVVGVGLPTIKTKWHAPYWIVLLLAYLLQFLSFVFRFSTKLHPFAIRMVVIHRFFNISKARRDLGYAPVVPQEEGFARTIAWLKQRFPALQPRGKDD